MERAREGEAAEATGKPTDEGPGLPADAMVARIQAVRAELDALERAVVAGRSLSGGASSSTP